jgi:hypothetical protein
MAKAVSFASACRMEIPVCTGEHPAATSDNLDIATLTQP